MSTKLYRVHSTEDGVRIAWVALGRKDAPGKPPGRYATFVGGLSAEEEATSQQRNAVDEFFTQEEAEAWCEYLRDYCDDENVEMIEKSQPLERNVEPLVSDLGSQTLIPRGKTKHYFSEFEVWGIPNNG
jgi:hypothetical protein